MPGIGRPGLGENPHDNCKDKIKVILEIGKRYVMFFHENPLYYHFLFTRSNVKLNEYPPFMFF